MRKLVFLVVLLALLAVADTGARLYAESRLAAGLQSSLRLDRRPDASIRGFPFLLHAVQRRFPEVATEARDVRIGAVPFDRVAVTLEDVRVSSVALAVGTRTRVRAERGRGSLEIVADGLAEALRSEGLDVTVRLGDGRAHLSGGGLPAEVSATVRVRAGSLVLTPEAAAAVGAAVDPIAVALPPLPSGLRYDDVRIGPGRAVLTLRARDAQFVA